MTEKRRRCTHCKKPFRINVVFYKCGLCKKAVCKACVDTHVKTHTTTDGAGLRL